MKRIVAMVIVVLALAGAMLAGCTAGSGSYQDSAWYNTLDTNNDGTVDAEEKKAMNYSGM